jgi:YlmC/YmxH family sporulation protein
VKCRLEELRYKEVIDIGDGSRYGFVGDVEFDADTGAIQALVIPGRLRWLGLLGREEDQVFLWPEVKRFGEDIILVDGGRRRKRE